ncbi:hypothetical protein SHD_0830 [Shewanella decolorationis S12]|uniref:Uncharacterized protein n=1 Tax=Shewanella decolorationis S12 TaxID=1353536 RepID=A0ABN0PQU6_9GAMM|nr:hypothetical protein SHD_0830 [Shewanella decolorationis S12]
MIFDFLFIYNSIMRLEKIVGKFYYGFEFIYVLSIKI